MRTTRFALVGLAFAIAIGTAATAQAQATLLTGLGGTAGFGEDSLAPNDDGSTGLINLSTAFPAGLRFYGRLYPGLYINNNGNVSFDAATGTFTPNAFPRPEPANPLIAPWWADIDTRNQVGVGTGNLVYWDITPGRLVVTWFDTGYFANHIDRRVSVQMILTDASAFGIAGAFDVEFRYNRCEWTTGDASGGTGGFGGTPAQAGFDAGDGINTLTLPGSRTAAVVNLCTTSNVGLTSPGVWRFQVRPSGVTVCGNNVRELGEECDDGDLTNGDGCNARCATELPPGSMCGDDIACGSGFCVDGVCCNARCGSQCQACDIAGRVGTCSPTTGAPHGSRTRCAAAGTTCGGVCNGTLTTACTFPPATVTCNDGSACSMSDVCNGAGGCAGVGITCDDALSCTADSCAVGICTNALVAGFCVIGGACIPAGSLDPTNDCSACNPASSTSAYTPRSSGSTCNDGTLCTGTDVCNGAGACAGTVIGCPDDGISCTTAMCEPLTGACTDVVTAGCLIGGACIADGTLDPTNNCLVCDVTKSTTSYSNLTVTDRCSEPMCTGATLTPARFCDGGGTCAPVDDVICASGCMDSTTCRGGCTTDAECPSERHCDMGVCVVDIPTGGACGRTEECASGFCVDGVCCGSTCSALCEACNLVGSEGTCAPHGTGTDPDDECNEELSCDGAGICEVPVVEMDGGMPDGGMGDAGDRDAGGADAGVGDASMDGSTETTPGGVTGGACGCSAAGTGRAPFSLLGLLGLALMVLRARKR